MVIGCKIRQVGQNFCRRVLSQEDGRRTYFAEIITMKYRYYEAYRRSEKNKLSETREAYILNGAYADRFFTGVRAKRDT